MSGRFVSRDEMGRYKWEEAIRNRLVKTGEYKRSNHTGICVCVVAEHSVVTLSMT